MSLAVPPTVVRLVARPVAPVLVKAKTPSPPTVFLTSLMAPRAVSVNVQTTWSVSPMTRSFPGVYAVGLPPLKLHTAPLRSQPVGIVDSVMPYVPGLTANVPVVPVPPTVVISGVDAEGPVTVNPNTPSPPTVFFMI